MAYARDRRSVYYCGEVLKGANPRTFRVLGDAEEQPAVIVSDRVTPSNDQRGMADWERFPAELLPGNTWVLAILKPITMCIIWERKSMPLSPALEC